MKEVRFPNQEQAGGLATHRETVRHTTVRSWGLIASGWLAEPVRWYGVYWVAPRHRRGGLSGRLSVALPRENIHLAGPVGGWFCVGCEHRPSRWVSRAQNDSFPAQQPMGFSLHFFSRKGKFQTQKPKNDGHLQEVGEVDRPPVYFAVYSKCTGVIREKYNSSPAKWWDCYIRTPIDVSQLTRIQDPKFPDPVSFFFSYVLPPPFLLFPFQRTPFSHTAAQDGRAFCCWFQRWERIEDILTVQADSGPVSSSHVMSNPPT